MNNKIIMITMLFLVVFMSCNDYERIYVHEIEFWIDDQRYYVNEKDSAICDEAYDGFSLGITEESYLMLRYSDDKYIILWFPKDTSGNADLTADRIDVKGAIDNNFDDSYQYTNIDIDIHKEFDFFSTSFALREYKVYKYTFSGTMQIDTSDDNFSIEIKNGTAEFGVK